MTEQRRRKRLPGRSPQQTEEQSLPITDRSKEEQEQKLAQADAVSAHLVTEILGEHQPHRVISNETLWRENVQKEGE